MRTRLRQRRAARDERQRRLIAMGELAIELTQQEILEDLFWPNPPPGRWPLGTAESSPVGLGRDRNGRIERKPEAVPVLSGR